MTAAAVIAAIAVTITVAAWAGIVIADRSQQIDRDIRNLIMTTPLQEETQ